MQREGNDKCWRQCGGIGSYLHCWLYCPVAIPFWQEIKVKILETLEISIGWSLPLLLLTKLDDPLCYKPEGISLLILLSATRSTVAQAWKVSKTL